jgi:hypothetical protein
MMMLCRPVVAVVAAFSLAGCGLGLRDEPHDGLARDTARFTYGARAVEIPLTACGRDGDVVLLAGHRGPDLLQAAADLSEDGAARTGVTAEVGGEGIFGAFGPDIDHGPAGEITSVRVAGDRLIVEGRWAVLDSHYVPVQAATVPGRLVARCPD